MEISGIELQLRRIANALESLLEKPNIVPGKDFDPDEFSEVTYTDESQELVEQHLNRRVGGIVTEEIEGLY